MKWSILVVLMIMNIYGFGQLNVRYELDSLNNQPYNILYSLQEKNDTIFIMGRRKEAINNINYFKSFLLKINVLGNILDYQSFDYDFHYGDFILIKNGGLAFVGSHMVDSLVFCRINNNSIDVNFYKFSTLNVLFEGRNIIETSDNNFLLLGKQYDYNNSTSKEYIIKTDSIGNEIWRRGYNMSSGVGYWTTPTAIFETNDSNYIALQAIRRYGQGNLAYEEVTSIEKVDTSGNQLWEYKTPINRLIAVKDGLLTEDNGVVFCGTEGEKVHAGVFYQGYIQKIDSLQQMEWEHILGHPENSGLNDIEILADGSYLASGFDVITYPDSVPINDSDSSRMMGWLVKIAPNGTKLWERHYLKYNSHPLQHIINETHEMDNGDLLSVGQNQTSIVTPGYWGWLIRTDSFGCIVPGCQLLDNTENISVLFDNEVTVFPNPASEMVHFRFDKAIDEKVEIRVYSGLGQLVGQGHALANNATEINVSDWNNGVYYYGIYVKERLVKQGQILVQN